MNKGVWVVVVLVLVLGGAYFLMSDTDSNGPVETNNEVQEVPVGTATTSGSGSTAQPTGSSAGSSGSVSGSVNVNVGVTAGAVKEFTVEGKNFSLTPSTLAVKKGDRVKITFKNTGGSHDLRVTGYNVGTPVISSGTSSTFEFVADKAGSFEYYCSVGAHRTFGMKGTLTVTE